MYNIYRLNAKTLRKSQFIHSIRVQYPVDRVVMRPQRSVPVLFFNLEPYKATVALSHHSLADDDSQRMHARFAEAGPLQLPT